MGQSDSKPVIQPADIKTQVLVTLKDTLILTAEVITGEKWNELVPWNPAAISPSRSHQVPTPHSCRYCQKLVIDRFQGREIAPVRVKAVLRQEQLSFTILDITLQEMRRAGSDGCLLCSWILTDNSTFVADNHEVFLAVKERLGVWMFGAFKDGKRVGIASNPVKFVPATLPQMLLTSAPTEYRKINGQKSIDRFSTKPINMTPASHVSLDMANGWLKSCLETHNSCPKPHSSFMPTRVIEIRKKDERYFLRLCETIHGKPEPYVALSYCWGGRQLQMTTSLNFLQRLVTLPWEDLPATIRDAILVTNALGLKNLWVDSLCIVQDDLVDIAVELSKMPLIYIEATLTITASRSQNVEEGFLHDRTETSQLLFRLPVRAINGHLVPTDLLPDMRICEPLSNRAWALQERILSTRVLDYGSLQTRWHCAGAEYSRGLYIDGFKHHEDTYAETPSFDGSHTLRAIFAAQSDPVREGSEEYWNLLKRWQNLVSAYTCRSLTFDTDRLVAISGIASQMGRVLNHRYCAGLWWEGLKHELLWRLKIDHGYNKELTPRPLEYLAPSWSWASITRPIKLPGLSNGSINLLKVSDCRTTLLGGKSLKSSDLPVKSACLYGAVSNGHLDVYGRLAPARWRYNPSNYKTSIQESVLSWQGSRDCKPIFFFPDALENEFVIPEVDFLNVFLLVVTERSPANIIYDGLVLRKVGALFSRVGVFQCHTWPVGGPQFVFGNSQMRTITII